MKSSRKEDLIFPARSTFSLFSFLNEATFLGFLAGFTRAITLTLLFSCLPGFIYYYETFLQSLHDLFRRSWRLTLFQYLVTKCCSKLCVASAISSPADYTYHRSTYSLSPLSVTWRAILLRTVSSTSYFSHQLFESESSPWGASHRSCPVSLERQWLWLHRPEG